MYLAIDPGAHPGWAVLDSGLRLVECGINLAPRRAYKVCLYEKPNIYPTDTPKKREDILTLCVTTGKLVGPFEELGARLVAVNPRTWKGQIPKDIHHSVIFGALTPAEQDVVDVCLRGVSPKWREDAMDAVGLAAYGRRMRVFRD